MRYLYIVFIAILFIVSSPDALARQRPFSIITYGAISGDKTINTFPIQKAINKAAAAGGGRVLVPPGRFYTGPIQLKSGVHLFLSEGATLLGSTKRIEYGKADAQPLISARQQKNVSVSGKGTIDGNGRAVVKDLIRLLGQGILTDAQWLVKRPMEKNRPKMIEFTECENVTVKGITVKNGAAWIQDYVRCDGVLIDSVRVESTEYWNNDGIDIVNSKNVRITNCYVDAADDAICLKSEGLPGTCENIVVENCTLRSSASGFKIGTGSYGGFRNIKVNNLHISNTYRSAIALEAVDGGFIEDVDIRNIIATHTGNAIFIRLGHRNTTEKYSTIERVYVGNLSATIPANKPDAGYPVEGPALLYPHNVFPSSITGIPGHLVKNVTLENIDIRYEGTAKPEVARFSTDSLEKVPENSAGYPEFSMFGELPAWGFYLRHAEKVTMKNIKLSMADDFRAACVFDDVSGLIIKGLTIPSGKDLPVIVMHKVTGLTTSEFSLPVTIQRISRIIE